MTRQGEFIHQRKRNCVSWEAEQSASNESFSWWINCTKETVPKIMSSVQEEQDRLGDDRECLLFWSSKSPSQYSLKNTDSSWEDWKRHRKWGCFSPRNRLKTNVCSSHLIILRVTLCQRWCWKIVMENLLWERKQNMMHLQNTDHKRKENSNELEDKTTQDFTTSILWQELNLVEVLLWYLKH